MSRKYSINNPGGIYFITLTCVEWLDIFIREEFIIEFVNNLNFCQQTKGLSVHAFCIMSSHVHLIVSSSDSYNLSATLRDLKSFTSKRIINNIRNNKNESRSSWLIDIMTRNSSRNSNNLYYQLWRRDNHPIEIFSHKWIRQKLDYIHLNPVIAGYVDDPTHWKWSSSSFYEIGKPSAVNLEFLTLH